MIGSFHPMSSFNCGRTGGIGMVCSPLRKNGRTLSFEDPKDSQFNTTSISLLVDELLEVENTSEPDAKESMSRASRELPRLGSCVQRIGTMPTRRPTNHVPCEFPQDHLGIHPRQRTSKTVETFPSALSPAPVTFRTLLTGGMRAMLQEVARARGTCALWVSVPQAPFLPAFP